jgi:signal peptidase I
MKGKLLQKYTYTIRGVTYTQQLPPFKVSKASCLAIYSILLLCLFRTFIAESFSIPGASMEGTLTKGDQVICSNIHYGKRVLLPFDLPLFYQDKNSMYHQLLPSYFRLFGLRKIQRNDMLVFNFPADLEKNIEDKQYYIKRCIALPGDTFEIRDRKPYVNDLALEESYKPQFSFLVKTQAEIDKSVFQKFGIQEFYKKEYGYLIYTTEENAKRLTSIRSITMVIPNTLPKGMKGSFILPPAAQFNWNRDNFGKLTVPFKGMTIKTTAENLALYKHIILHYEGLKKVKIEDDRLFINGKEFFQYTFTQNYYFTLGDNRHNSYDSRYWGLLPEDHVVGKPILVVYSYNPNKSIFAVRWDRIWKWID